MSVEDLLPESEEVRPAEADGPSGLVERLLSFLTGGSDPERRKRRMLKDIAKQLKKQRYKFYRPKGEQALPGLARFFWELYSALGPAQVLLQNADNSGAIKTIIIEESLTAEQQAVREHFDEEAIRRRAQEMNPKELANALKEELVTFFSAFDINTVKTINATYNQLRMFLHLVNFDYYFLLKKFDASLPERNFSYSPRFESINGEYVLDDLKDFLELIPYFDREVDWERLVDVCHAYRNVEVVARPAWRKALARIRDVRRAGVLELMIKHTEKNPNYKPTVRGSNEKIVEPYLTKLKTQTELTIQKIAGERRTAKIDSLTQKVFGTTAISRLKNYTDKANVMFSKKMLAGYTMVAPLNYLKAFYLDYFKRDTREVVDLLLIKGKWSTNLLSQQLSESFHQLLELSDQLIRFDESLGEDGELGSKLKTVLHRADRDKSSLKYLRTQLKDINEQAAGIVNSSAQHLINVGKGLKLAVEDYAKQPHELIVNWKEIEAASDRPIHEKIVEVYKKLYYFIQLLQQFAKSNK